MVMETVHVETSGDCPRVDTLETVYTWGHHVWIPLSVRPHDLADMISARPEVACVPISYVSCAYSKRAALTRALVASFTNERFVRLLSQPAVELTPLPSG